MPVGLSGVTAIAAGAAHSVVLKSDGTVVAWGRNSDGQTTVPSGLNGVTAIAAGGYHTVALKSDGTVVAWGWNNYGQTTVPSGLNGVTVIAAGSYQTFALKSDGTVVAWGRNLEGQTTVPAGLSGVTAIAAGFYHTVALVGSSAGSGAPVITAQPAAQTISSGSTVIFSVAATGAPAPTYQWRKDGVNISGATSATLVVQGATVAGSYFVSVANSFGTVVSNPAALTVSTTSNPGRLINLSVLSSLASPGETFSLGYVVSGASSTNAKPLVIRAAGPSLGALGVPGTLDDPKLELFAGSSKTDENENWGGASATITAMAAVGAFAYTSPTSRDAAVVANITSRDNSVKISAGAGTGTGTGSVIAEVYDATPAGAYTASTPRLINFSVIKPISAGGYLTLGFTIGGSTAETVLIRVIGPGLAAVGLTSGTLSDPQLTLYNSLSQVIATNDDWGADSQLSTAGSRVGAFSIGTTPTKDAMLIITLPSGAYTATATGNGGTSGQAIVEVYEVP